MPSLFPYLRLLRNLFLVPQHRRQRKVNAFVAESLEIRTLLTNFVVTTLDDVVADDGLVSLREAIEASNRNEAFSDVHAGQEEGDTISFDPSLAGGRIMQKLGRYNIFDDLVITGSETDRIVIDSSDISARAFRIKTNESVSLSNLELTGSRVRGSGGAMRIAGGGDVTLTNLDINNNSALAKGGGIFISSPDGSPRVTIIDSTISNNFAGRGGGGGIYNDGASVIIERSLIENNVAGTRITSHTWSFPGRASGGGIYNQEGTINVRETSISGNYASVVGGGIYNQGGMLDVRETSISGNYAVVTGGGINNSESGMLSISDATIDGNTARGNGGGIANFAGEGLTTTLVDVVISNNIAGRTIPQEGPATFYSWSTGYGGGIYFAGLGQLEITRSRIDSNLASTAGGGIYVGSNLRSLLNNPSRPTVTITDSQIDNNEARSITGRRSFNPVRRVWPGYRSSNTSFAGGGVYNKGGNITFNRSTISGNSGYGDGGGIYSEGGWINLNQSEVSNNTARKFDEQAVSGGNGGGVAVAGSDFRAVGSVINNNTSENGNGGGFWSKYNNITIGFAINDPFWLSTRSVVGPLITDTFITTPGSYEAIFVQTQISGNSAAKQGGGMWLGANGEVTITDSTISNNRVGNEESWRPSHGDIGGGGIYNESTLTIQGSIINDNVAGFPLTSETRLFSPTFGGGIFNEGGTIDIQETSISGNNAATGGGIYNNSITFGGNYPFFDRWCYIGTSTISIRTGTVNIFHGTTIRDNIARNGGGIYNSFGDVNIEGTLGSRVRILNNIAISDGGGIYNGDLGSLSISRTTINSNQAGGNGGGIADYAGVGYTTFLSDVSITNNSAVQGEDATSLYFIFPRGRAVFSIADGGGIYFGGSGTLEITRSRIASNSASSYGGGIYNSTGTINMTQTRIINNEALGEDRIWTGATINPPVPNPFRTSSAGGGIYNASGNITIDTSTISGNIGFGDGGGIFSAGGEVTLNRSRVIGNTAKRDVDALNWSGLGGGVAVTGGLFQSTRSVISNNTAENGNGGGFWGGTPDDFTSFASSGFEAIFMQTLLSGNSASEQGGGMWIGAGGEVTFDRTRLVNNTASGENGRAGGGGLYNDGGKVQIQRSVIGYNAALSSEGKGGGIYNASGGEIDVRRFSYIIGNRAGQSGGGIYNAGDATVEKSFILANRARKIGGAIHNDEGAVLEIVETLFGGNFAPRFSGIFNDGELIRN